MFHVPQKYTLKYRFGFQGQEKESDISGNDGDYLSYTYRIHDTRLGRFLSVDPLEMEYPWNSPYTFSENRVISAVELEGLEAHDLNNGETAYGPYAPGVIDGVNKGYSSGYFSLEIPFSEAKNEIINKTSAFSQEEPGQGSLVTGIREPWGVRQCINCPKGPIPSIDPVTNEVSGTIEMSMGLWEDGTSFLGAEVGVGKPSIGESMIPIWGSGRSAVSDFQNGRYVSGTFNSIMAVSDVFLVKSVATSVGKGAWKAGSNSWRATRSWYGKTRNLPKGSQVHHWLIHNNGTIGKNVPNYIKNQPWNFKVFSNQSTHFRYGHGWSFKGQQGANAIGRLWYGTPTWTKALTLSYGGRGVNLTLGTLGD